MSEFFMQMSPLWFLSEHKKEDKRTNPVKIILGNYHVLKIYVIYNQYHLYKYLSVCKFTHTGML